MLKQLSFVVLSIIFLNTSSFAQSRDVEKGANKIIKNIVGTWKISQVTNVQNKKKMDVTKMDKSNGLVTLQLKRDGRYRTTDDQNAIDSGSYRINESQGKMYLESDLNRGNPKEWNLKLEKDLLTLIADSSKNTQHTMYVYKREVVTSGK